ncbi:hypothetical protein KM043_010627 [Ampulex compressa]|nr:hypothetical protein KM043_010627 [Ampulex compressa]
MSVVRNENKITQGFDIPRTKLKNVPCVQCKHQFFIQDLIRLRGPRVPLLLICGHAICDGCFKSDQNKQCPVCNVSHPCDQSKTSLLPLNVYTLGLLVISCNRSFQTNEPDVAFFQPSVSKLRHSHSQGYCHECGIQATIRCPQCVVLYCCSCYAKIHGRALQNHTKILISALTSDNILMITTHCLETCREALKYYCKDCQVPACTQCTLEMHPKHDFVLLSKKNEENLSEFNKAVDGVAESVQRIHQAQKVSAKSYSIHSQDRVS